MRAGAQTASPACPYSTQFGGTTCGSAIIACANTLCVQGGSGSGGAIFATASASYTNAGQISNSGGIISAYDNEISFFANSYEGDILGINDVGAAVNPAYFYNTMTVSGACTIQQISPRALNLSGVLRVRFRRVGSVVLSAMLIFSTISKSLIIQSVLPVPQVAIGLTRCACQKELIAMENLSST